MSRDTRIQLLAATLLVLCLGVSAFLTVNLAGIAGRYKLVYTDRAEEGQRWEVSAGIAMGAFRGVFVNYLWIRANDLKEAGKFYEAVELSRAITRLQPRFPRVWVFHAWNLAYNISVTTQTAEERWQWVNRGISLLRDEGIPANPNDMLLHKELAWIYLHKIAEWTDDANQYYKRKHAEEWTIVMGEPPAREPGDKDRDAVTRRYADWLRPIADAPTTTDELIARYPSTAPLIEKLRAAGLSPGMGLLDRYETYTHLLNTSNAQVVRSTPGAVFAGIAPLIDDPAHKDAWPPLLAFVRRSVLTDRYHMEPERMLRYTETYGPIDWRSAAAHSLYWSLRGVEVGQTRWYAGNRRDFDFLNTDRVVVQSIQELFRYGDIYFDFTAFRLSQSSGVMYLALPNPHFVKPYGDVLADVEARSARAEFNPDNPRDRGYRPMASGYENFLRDAICFFYARGDRRSAEYWQHVLITWPGINIHYNREDVRAPLDEFVANELADRVGTPNVAVAQINGALFGAYAAGLLAGDLDLFQAQFGYAARFHAAYMTQQLRHTNVNPDAQRMAMLDPDFRVVAGIGFYQFMSSLTLDNAEKVYDSAPNDLRLYAYDMLQERFKSQLDEIAASGGPETRTFERIFPAPDGLDAFRAEQARRLRELQERELSTERR